MIVETQEQAKQFFDKYINHASIIIPILTDGNLHPLQTKISLIYVKLIGGSDYILPFNHSEAQNLALDYIDEFYKSDKIKYTYDKKNLNHIMILDNVIDVNLVYYLKNNIPLDIAELDLPIYRYYRNTYYHKTNLNKVIPILKHLEYCRELAKVIRTEKDKMVNDIYNNKIINILTYIESAGMRYYDKMVYSEYNMYTSTGRPSNSFGGINFAALNKTDGSREPFVSRFGSKGMLVEFDFDAYHLRLIGDVIDYKFPKDIRVHEYFGEQYGIENYDKSKARSFKYLYGSTPQEIIDTIPYFKRVNEHIESIWSKYGSSDFIKSDIYSKRIYKKNLRYMTKNKLFNYLIQLLETENNMKILAELIPLIDGYKSKLILYNYDSFLFDFHLEDEATYLHMIKKTLEQNGKYPIKVSCGLNYHKMRDITEKFK